MLNKVMIIGNLGRDPELRYTQSGMEVCNLSVATTRKWKTKAGDSQEETEWHKVTVWGATAVHCNAYLAKGRRVYIEGRLKTTSYDKDGEKRYQTEIVADNVKFLSSVESSAGGARSAMHGGQAPGMSDDEDIPFAMRGEV